ncbi:MAG: NAD-dependent deacylase [Candidatus Acinetobacter avistercoris]|uniref:SIR2 family NAD-dependent protein deacylase n=1 Tax=Acinetobacter sp. KS-LM10 TaxID=3120518 RepID=UPI001F98E170|nr:NAD-dependent deacylase [Candidatus Acinetobacter avistercoris]
MKNIVIFSGAGMSAESGIDTFRGNNGLWENHDIQDVATPEAWTKNPMLVQRFYNERRKNIMDARPNAAHDLIAELEKHYSVQVITQNIDDLHERASSTNVLHLHGNIRLAKSSGPDAQATTEFYPISGAELDLERDKCPLGYPLRPHVVWFGEAVTAYEEAIELMQHADLLVVIGSSLSVYPVAGLIHEISSHCEAYYIDPQADHSRVPEHFHCLNMTASEGMKVIAERLKAKSLE